MKDFVLRGNQKKIIKKIDFLGNKFYLAGGTALALQIGHRTSVDFDFYSEKGFNSEKLFKQKYQEMFNQYIGSRSLIYFEDAKKKQARTRIYLYDPSIDWKTIKSYLKDQVIFFQKSIIKELRK